MATPTEEHFNSNKCKTVHIGHASTSNPSSGLVADEVLVSNYYSSMQPTVVLRPITAELAEKSALACEAGCRNDKIEYSQDMRGTLYTEAGKVGYDLSKITATCYADCSSFMTVCAIAGGAELNFSYIPTCGNIRSVLLASGKYTALTTEKYLNSSDYLQRGDILVRENYKNGSRHTAMVLDNGSKAPAAITNFLKDLTTLKATVEITNVSSTSISATARAIIVEDNTDKLTKELDMLKWNYVLTTIGADAGKSVLGSIDIKSGTAKFNINGLVSGGVYGLKVQATDGKATFSSPITVVTTSMDKNKSASHIIFTDDNKVPKINKVYVKVKDSYKPVIIYNNT
jgi:hypothetical protein